MDAPSPLENSVPYNNDEMKISMQKISEIEVYAYFVSVGSNSIVSYFDCKICSQVAVPQSQITMRAKERQTSAQHIGIN